MVVIKLTISNLLSIENAIIDFLDKGLTLVEGWNSDLDRSNGAGKTSIFNALSFALYDKVPRKITASEILRRGATKGSVHCELLIGQDKWEVIRSRPKGVLFKKNGVDVTITQLEFESLIKLSYDQFLATMYCSQNSNSRFIALNDSDKKAFILRLLNLDKFTKYKQLADAKVKSLINEISSQQGEIDKLLSQCAILNESIIDIEPLHRDALQIDIDIISLKQQADSLSNIERPDISKYDFLEESANNKISKLMVLKHQKQSLTNELKKLNVFINSTTISDICDSCGSVLDVSAAKEHHYKEINTAKLRISEIESEISKLDISLAEEDQFIDLKLKIKQKKAQEMQEYSDAVNQIKALNNQIASMRLKHQQLTSKIEQSHAANSRVYEINIKISNIESNIAQNKDKLAVATAVSSVLSPTGAPSYILDSVIDSFNEKIKEYIDMLWPHATYTLRSYRENAKGDITTKFSEQLIVDGVEVSVGSLSGGEYRAVSLCIDFAFLSLLEANFGIKLNPVILDEPFDGLDSAGREIVVELLAKISENRNVVTVDHMSESKALFSDIIFVTKTNGISSIARRS